MRITHKDAAQIVNEAFFRVFGREPTRPERQCCQAVGWLETGYGQHWDSRGAGSNNWGAIQATKIWQGPTFEYVDTSPNPDGTSTPYHQAFRSYPAPIDGAKDLVKVVYTGGRNPILGATEKIANSWGSRGALALPAAARGDTAAFSAALYDTVYFQGFGRTREERIGHHLKAVNNACTKMAIEIGETMPDGSEPPKPIPVYRLGSEGQGVDAVQRFLGLDDDGVFGPVTDAALRKWQRENRLNYDGVWGPVCFHIVATEVSGEDVDDLMGLL